MTSFKFNSLPKVMRGRTVMILSVVLLLKTTYVAEADEVLHLHLQMKAEVSPDNNRFREVVEPVKWDAKQTAIVICDMWNDLYCRNGARRVAEMAPHMNNVLKKARDKVVLIIHSPSNCMKHYEGTPQRKLARSIIEAPLDGVHGHVL